MFDFKVPQGSDLKQEAHDIVETLSNFNPTIDGIHNSIRKSNEYIKDLEATIKSAHHKNEILRTLSLLRIKNTEEKIKADVAQFILELSNARGYGILLENNYQNCIERLAKISETLIDEPSFQNNLVQIISINQLKLENIRSQIKNADNHLATLENFKVFNLYHLKDAITVNQVAQSDILHEQTVIERTNYSINFTKNIIKKAKKGMIFFGVLSFLNLLSNYYKFHFTRTSKVFHPTEQDYPTPSPTTLSGSELSTLATDMTNFMSSMVSAMSVVLTGLAFCFLVMGVFQRKASMIVMGCMGFGSVLIFKGVMGAILGLNNESYDIVEKTYNISFFSFGVNGSLFMIGVVALLYAFYRYKSKYLVQVETAFLHYLKSSEKKEP